MSLIDVFANIAILALCAGIPLILVWGSLRGLEKFRRGGTDKADAFEHERRIRKLEAEKDRDQDRRDVGPYEIGHCKNGKTRRIGGDWPAMIAAAIKK